MYKYYLHVQMGRHNNAGSKAVADCERILEKCSYKRILLYKASSNRMKRNFSWLVGLCRLSLIRNNSKLVIEHPIYIHKDYFRVLRHIKKRKNIKLIFIVHDLECIRQYLPDSSFYANRDFVMFDIADDIIVHNEAMANYLIEHNVSPSKIINLRLFDYLCDTRPCKISDNNEIVIAGNLSKEKSTYIYKLGYALPKGIFLNLYGSNLADKNDLPASCNYCGSFDADILPGQLCGKFGLVWDGTSIDSCKGHTGDYLRFNNPHKMSLYIAAGLPIIIWDKAAQASFVKKYEIGFTISNLGEISQRFSQLRNSDYLLMRNNVLKIRKKVINGDFLRNALNGL